MLAVFNTAVLTVYARLVGETGLNRVGAWFFGLLLTMIIVLFDRFRGERLARIQPALVPRRSVSPGAEIRRSSQFPRCDARTNCERSTPRDSHFPVDYRPSDLAMIVFITSVVPP